MTIVRGRSLELYYVDGRPDGLLTAELFNWTGHVLKTPRQQIKAALSRAESSYTGVYLLTAEHDGKLRVYVGEGEDIAIRISTHEQKKDWWTAAVLVTTVANKLNKAHAKYLEARLLERARSVGHAKLDNEKNPKRPTLSEADIAKMETFLDNLFIVLPALRIDVFVERTRPSLGDGGGPTPQQTDARYTSAIPAARFVLNVPKHGIEAHAVLIDGEFIVEANSSARKAWQGKGTEHSFAAQLHVELKQNGTLTDDGPRSRFVQNYAFTSPSAAASVVAGRPTSGPASWREVGSGRTYKDWEAEQLAALGASDP
jgi:hypothetical protein